MINIKKASPLATLALAGALLGGCDDPDYKNLDEYQGYSVVSSNNISNNFHSTYETSDGQYIVQLGSTSWLLDSNGKLLTVGSMEIHRDLEGNISLFNGTKQESYTGIDLTEFDKILGVHKNVLNGLDSSSYLVGNNAWNEYHRLETQAWNCGDDEHASLLRLARLTKDSGIFERRDDGLYVRFNGEQK
ncbi:hypothetical protein J4438_02945 [Candidatus Woesearchaeota archaeon]|nr:hypothetical protein [Candidatus Woesearchaeota archaeon]